MGAGQRGGYARAASARHGQAGQGRLFPADVWDADFDVIGLVGVAISLFLGILMGGLSGFKGGWTDSIIQRVIEFLRAMPTIPVWLALGAAVPQDWSVVKVYFAISVIISLIGWTTLAREVRGRFLAMREEDFVTAAQLYGSGQLRVIFRHMLPSFMSHIIATTTLAIPAIIIAETSLRPRAGTEAARD